MKTIVPMLYVVVAGVVTGCATTSSTQQNQAQCVVTVATDGGEIIQLPTDCGGGGTNSTYSQAQTIYVEPQRYYVHAPSMQVVQRAFISPPVVVHIGGLVPRRQVHQVAPVPIVTQGHWGTRGEHNHIGGSVPRSQVPHAAPVPIVTQGHRGTKGEHNGRR